MAFKITARTLLELGAELISSDAIALYELIKNGVDAGSPTIHITVQSVLPHSRFLQALEAIDEKRTTLASIRQSIEGWFSDDAPAAAKRKFLQTINKVEEDSFREGVIQAYYEANFIRIEDSGEGMSIEDLEEVYLTIGTRSRRREKESWGERDKPDRILLGDKGVGRLSVMRLGNKLNVITTKSGERRWNLLNIDWKRFSHDSDALLHEIDLKPELGDRKEDYSTHGTIIHIYDLKADWDRVKFGELLGTDFARMVDPFDRHRANRLFRIHYNDEPVTLPQISKRLFDLSHAIVEFDFGYDEKTGEANLLGEMEYRLHAHKKKAISVREIELLSIQDH